MKRRYSAAQDPGAWGSHTILRYLAALHPFHLTGATPAERTQVERWMDWNLGALNAPYVAVFKDAKDPRPDTLQISLRQAPT